MDLSSKKILITGATGFIGKHLAEAISKKFGIKVHGLSLDGEIESDYADLQVVDLRDFDQTRKAIEEISPDIVFHLAGCTGKTSKDFKGSNVEGTENLLKSLVNIDYDLFVFTSTSEVYGSSEAPFKEEEVNPVTEYARTKFEAEEICRRHIKNGKPIVISRLGLVYGPGQQESFFIPGLIKASLEKDSFDTTLGEQTRDFVYVDDVISAFMRMPFSVEAVGQTINISSGDAISLRRVVEKIKKTLDSKIKINFGAIPYRENEIFKYQLNIERAKKLLNWQPEVDLDEGLNKTIAWYINNS